MKRTKLTVKPLLLISLTRKYIIRNHIYLEESTPHFYIQSMIRSGGKAKAELLLLSTLKLLQPVCNPSQLLHKAAENLVDLIEISPVRTGKKVRMIARAASSARQHKRSPFLLSKRLRNRRFQGASFANKLAKEIISSIYYPEESARRALQSLVFSAGFLNLRYLYKRWY